MHQLIPPQLDHMLETFHMYHFIGGSKIFLHKLAPTSGLEIHKDDVLISKKRAKAPKDL